MNNSCDSCGSHDCCDRDDSLSDQIAEQAAEIAEIRETSEHINQIRMKEEAELSRLKGVLTAVANIAHHGGLTGLNDSDIRRLTFPYWDMVECERLQLSGGG
jgi:hypothetical protein